MAKPDLTKYRDRMDKSVNALKEDFGGLRTGRASSALLEGITVEAYGASTPILSCAAISVPEPRMISVNVWDRGLVVSVEKAIRNSGLGLNPITDGQNLRVPIPPPICVVLSLMSPVNAARPNRRTASAAEPPTENCRPPRGVPHGKRQSSCIPW